MYTARVAYTSERITDLNTDHFQNFLIRAWQENENKTVIVLIMQTRYNNQKYIIILHK